MPILIRYLIGSVFGASFAGVALFVFVLLTGNVLKDIAGLLAANRLNWSLFGDLLLLLIPYAIAFALPMGLLIGILLTMGRLSSQKEIVAMQSAGISLWRICFAVLTVSVVGAGFSWYVNHEQAPSARGRYRAILGDLVRLDPLQYIQARTFVKDFPGFVIYVGDREGGGLKDFWLWVLDSEQRPVNFLRAEQASLEYLPEEEAFLLSLRNGIAEQRNPDTADNFTTVRPNLVFKEWSFKLPIGNAFGKRTLNYNPARISSSELRARIEAADERTGPTERSEIRYQLQKRHAQAVGVIALGFLAFPLGIITRRTETYANLGIALLLAFSYYLLGIIVDWQRAYPERHPELLVWLPNLFAFALGLWLMRRLNSGK